MFPMKINCPPLNLTLHKDFKLMVNNQLREPDIRTLGQMKEVVPDTADLPDNTPLYYMYRDAKNEKDAELFEQHNIRFDITVVPPLMFGKEFVKTTGHFHPNPPDQQGLSYPEIYEVLHGQAHYLLQDKDGADVVIIRAKAGEKVIIMPNYGHITINPFSEVLVMCNLISSVFSSDYGPIKDRKGAAVFETVDGIVKNENYPSPTEPVWKNGQHMAKNSYELFLENPAMFEFLNKPELAKETL